jgi:hypothetical protein
MMPDYIHMIVQLPPTINISQALHLLKRASSHELLSRQPLFHYRYAAENFWSPRKFYRSIDDADTAPILDYTRNQGGFRLYKTPAIIMEGLLLLVILLVQAYSRFVSAHHSECHRRSKTPCFPSHQDFLRYSGPTDVLL